MTKKEQEIQSRLLDLLDANTKVLEEICKLLVQAANPPLIVSPDGTKLDLKPGVILPHSPADEEVPGPTPEKLTEEPIAETCTDTEPEITPEYCRKALKAITKKTSTKEAKAFLAKFGDAKTIPQLDKKYYGDFIEDATKIMEEE